MSEGSLLAVLEVKAEASQSYAGQDSPSDGADTAVWLVATRPESREPHFWHDRAQRPVVLPGQRPPAPDAVARLVDYVTDATGAGVGVTLDPSP